MKQYFPVVLDLQERCCRLLLLCLLCYCFAYLCQCVSRDAAISSMHTTTRLGSQCLHSVLKTFLWHWWKLNLCKTDTSQLGVTVCEITFVAPPSCFHWRKLAKMLAFCIIVRLFVQPTAPHL